MDEVAQRRLDRENTRADRKVEDPVEPELVRALQGQRLLVAADKEAHPLAAIGRLDLDQPLGARRRVERSDVVARAVSVDVRHPAEVGQEVFASSPGEAALLLIEDELLALLAERAVAGVPGNGIEFARQPNDWFRRLGFPGQKSRRIDEETVIDGCDGSRCVESDDRSFAERYRSIAAASPSNWACGAGT